MKILHIDFTSPYTEGMTYQENILPAEHVKLGHEVELWTSCYIFDNGIITMVPQGCKTMSDGVKLRRWAYTKYVNAFISQKLRNANGIYQAMEDFSPDFIMQHDAQTMITPTVCKYVRNHTNTRYVLDCHSDYYNSAKGLISKNVLHRCIYRRYVREAYDTAEAVYCISFDVKRFVTEIYGLDQKKIHILPLGSTILEQSDYEAARKKKRGMLGVGDTTTVFVHSGKLTPGKKTKIVLNAMKKLNNTDIRLVIIGSADEELKKEICDSERNDSRVIYLGWKKGKELVEWLCAGDVYIHPGSQSNTVQTAMCCREAVLVYPYESYKSILEVAGFPAKDEEELKKNMQIIAENHRLREEKRDNALKYAKKYLDYAIQAVKVIGNDNFQFL